MFCKTPMLTSSVPLALVWVIVCIGFTSYAVSILDCIFIRVLFPGYPVYLGLGKGTLLCDIGLCAFQV